MTVIVIMIVYTLVPILFIKKSAQKILNGLFIIIASVADRYIIPGIPPPIGMAGSALFTSVMTHFVVSNILASEPRCFHFCKYSNNYSDDLLKELYIKEFSRILTKDIAVDKNSFPKCNVISIVFSISI